MDIQRHIKTCAWILAVGLIMQTAACGTIIHPERRGQEGGRLDPAIVALNAVGLLFYVVPGAIAFAVDFATGTIYLPNGDSAQLSKEQMERIAEQGNVRSEELEKVLRQDLGIDVSLKSRDVKIRVLKSEAQMHALLAHQQTVAMVHQ
ncbi:hypothetical protein [Marinimicrobium sp. ABcell2]|uniref:hypothetical protein n=1 Tax=Marinimicrobium sp. ABcell2 TaxID=3069751 RepID=UPI0027AEA9DF|nr:hypothetical protein [Marinimicrobium sp. ABcell2]MDQ2078357.1 hypothetical protein [Marinimicrobium sp. ABcell2]